MSITTEDQVCVQCGICCVRWGWDQKGIVDDLLPWLETNRTDILQHVAIRLSNGKRVSGTDITAGDLSRIVRIYYWQDTAGRKMRECPFFRRNDEGKARCGIHDVKPRVCREFTPWTWQNNEFYGNCPACREKAP
ncbi:MAG: YkgJ family cysteine cluster protein [Methanomicrobiales archaeon]|nr:YkgJ family cysteine cluster protein [Methanomicrobiales archaeon]NYT21442.1 YkgJ family cysteine cluster protein [Methanomicrobiales archaeon]